MLSAGSPSAALSWGKRSSWGRGRLQLQGEKPTLGWVPGPSVPALFLAGREEPFPCCGLGPGGAAMSPSPGGAPCRGRFPPEGPQPSRSGEGRPSLLRGPLTLSSPG